MVHDLYILPFDHRGSFMKMLHASAPPTEADVEKARDYKRLIYEAFREAVDNGVPKDKAGILVDEWLGRDVLLAAKKDGFITCTPLEKSGQDEFDFDREDWQQQLAELAPTYAKVLVRYNPEGEQEMNARQAQRLATLSRYLQGKESRFLFELLVPATEAQLQKAGSIDGYEQSIRPALMAQAIRELHAAGVEPDIWKLEGLDTAESMQTVAGEATTDSRDAGIIILGRGESAKKAEEWLRVGAQVPAAVGFAVGRTIFKEPLEQLHNGNISREEAASRIAKNYAFFVRVWEEARA